MQSKSEEKWLGEYMSDKRLEKSVEATINHRFGKVFSAIFELKAVIEDLRFQMIGGLKCGIDIWEVAMILSFYRSYYQILKCCCSSGPLCFTLSFSFL